MTLIISWIGVDSKKEGKTISSLYIASDSRYSWGKLGKYDYGVKVFGSNTFPEIFGFCGDVTFPSIIIGQLIPQIDSGLLIQEKDTGEIRNNKVFDYIKTSFESYPKSFLTGPFTILHGTRFGKDFRLYKMSSNKNNLVKEEINLPKISTKVFSEGSGKKEFDDNWLNWESEKHNDFQTSRAVYHCLDKTLKEMKDPLTGGLPQIIGLYRSKNSRLFGTIKNDKKYIYGKECSKEIISETIEWRNENFERINPNTSKMYDGAQRQPTF